LNNSQVLTQLSAFSTHLQNKNIKQVISTNIQGNYPQAFDVNENNYLDLVAKGLAHIWECSKAMTEWYAKNPAKRKSMITLHRSESKVEE
jgi:hypothetical protein